MFRQATFGLGRRLMCPGAADACIPRVHDEPLRGVADEIERIAGNERELVTGAGFHHLCLAGVDGLAGLDDVLVGGPRRRDADPVIRQNSREAPEVRVAMAGDDYVAGGAGRGVPGTWPAPAISVLSSAP